MIRDEIIEKLTTLRTLQKTDGVRAAITAAEGWLVNGTRYSNEDIDILQLCGSALFTESQRTAGFCGCP